MHWKKGVIAVAAAALCFPSMFAFAQTQERGGMQDRGQTGQRDVNVEREGSMVMALRIHKASDLMGREVQNAEGQDLGEIKNLAIDPDSGRISYAVLSFGGFLDMGDKLFAIPWQSLQLQGEDQFVLNVDKSKLESAPGFDEEQWPNMASPRFGTEVYGHYGQKPYWEDESQLGTRDRAPTRIVKASDVIGKNVKNPGGADLGEIKNLAIDVSNGRVAYAVLSFGGFLDIGDKLFAVPWKAMSQTSADEITLDIDKDRLENAPQYEDKNWTSMSGKDYIVRTYTFYNVEPYWEQGKQHRPGMTDRPGHERDRKTEVEVDVDED